jgi:hypothetical protein
MNAAERNAKITSIIKGMKDGEVKLFQSGAKVYRDSYVHFGYSVVAPDGDTSIVGVSQRHAINLTLGSYR